MSDESFERVKELYLAAIDLDAIERAALLDSECGQDTDLRRRVEELLGYEDDPRAPQAAAGGFVEEELSSMDPTPRRLPEQIGEYRILGLLGEGGMGVVYEAEQRSPKRRVALKVLRAWTLDERAQRRFELEAELLGRLRHPAIASIHSAYTKSDGSGDPYFVMEFVDGEPITDFANRQQLSRAGRLELWARVCDAVQHAHDIGVIHRDLKPSNILVTAGGDPKVLDFGVAQVLDEELRTTVMLTNPGEVVGTLSYMSPEQAAGRTDEIDARSDVYALGAIGFELLTGALPYDLRGKPLPEAARQLSDTSPARPTTRVPDLDRDVETILLTAIDRDLQRRYASPEALSTDIRRYLGREPIQARPPSSLYQLRLFTRRNRAAVVGVVAVFFALVAGLIGTTSYAFRADQATARALEANEAAGTALEKQRLATQQAEIASYSSGMLAAAAAIEAGRGQEARRLLESMTEDLRGWEWYQFLARLDSSEALVDEEPELVARVALCDQGHGLFTLTREGTCTVRRLGDASVIESFELEGALGGGIVDFSLRADRDLLATVSVDRSLRLWSLASDVARLLHEHPGPTAASDTLGIDLSPTTTGCVLFGGRKSWLWRPETSRLERLASNARLATWSNDGTRIATGRMQILDGDTGRSIGRLPTDPGALRSAAFDPTDSRIAYGTRNGTIQVVDSHTGELQTFIRTVSGGISSLAWFHDGRQLITGDTRGTVQIWNLDDGSLIATLLGHEAAVQDLTLSTDDQRVAAVSADGRIRLWDLTRPEFRPESGDSENPVQAVAFSPDDELLAWSTRDGSVHLSDGLLGTPIATVATRLPGGPRGLAWTKDGSRLVTCIPALVVVDLPGGTTTRGERIGSEAPFGANGPTLESLTADVAWPGGLEFGRAPSPDGAWIVVGGRQNDRDLVIERVADRSELASFDGDLAFKTAFTADGSLLAIAWLDGSVQIVDTATFTTRTTLTAHDEAAHSVAFAPDGTRLATGGGDGTIRLWSTTDWSCTAVLRGHSGDVQALTFSVDGTRLASGSHDGVVRLWSRLPRRELVDRAQLADRRRITIASEATTEQLRQRWRSEYETEVLRELLQRETPNEAELNADRWEGEPGSGFGSALAALTAKRSDTPARIVIGAPRAGTSRTGAVELLDTAPLRRSIRIPGPEPRAQFGTSLTALDDLDGDGLTEFAVGAPGASGSAGNRTGAVFVYSGRGDPEPLLRIEGPEAGDQLGTFLCEGPDLNRDGRRELIAMGRGRFDTVRAFDPVSGRELRRWFLDRPAWPPFEPLDDLDGDGVEDFALIDSIRGVRFLSGADDSQLGVFERSELGDGERLGAVALADQDRDGLPEWVFSIQGWRAEEEARLERIGLRRSSDGSRQWRRRLVPTKPMNLGPRIRPVSDLDGDGVGDLIVWSSQRIRGRMQAGSAITVLSGRDGEILAEVPTPADARDGYGAATLIADVDGDGRPELLLGATDSSPPRLEVHALREPGKKPEKR